MLAQIAYAGFCATDIELLTGDMIHIKNGFTKYPIIPGHEWSGTIVAVGRDVRDLKVGDRITSDVSLGCGECDECRKGHYNLCPNREVVGSYRNRQGVFAEYVAVPQRHVYKIPENVSMEEAALAEPAATAMYAVSKAQDSRRGGGAGDRRRPHRTAGGTACEHRRCQQGHHGRQLG